MSDGVFSRYSSYYDLLYRDKDYSAESSYVAGVLRTALPEARSILELGCGTGKHAALLAQNGFEVLGVDRSREMLDNAPAIKGFECVQGDVRVFSAQGRLFDAAMALFHVVSYQCEDADVDGVFRTAAGHLPVGGLFFFDVWHGPAVLAQQPSVRVKRAGDEALDIVRIAEPALDTSTSTVMVNYTVFARGKGDRAFEMFREEHRMRYFFPEEIAELAGQHGFEVVRCEEFLSGLPLSESTWGAAYLLRKSHE